MPKTKTIIESAKPLDNAVDAADIWLTIFPATEPTDTVADRLHYRVGFPADRDDGTERREETEWKHLDDDVITTFVAGDSAALLPLLKKLVAEGMLDRGFK